MLCNPNIMKYYKIVYYVTRTLKTKLWLLLAIYKVCGRYSLAAMVLSGGYCCVD